ncbi:hypothetical protein GCM10010346_21520 [Streptomyces chryseus]|uniref:FAD/NAD(P)-binding domain-containing protein n=1 Tax=Streptomyces chryseus TaxID=68186 RepID=A0ABQ3DKR4_9ACTN|nr:hypothetical protein GCM10010346_21520 [Streptomyces chryseus]
MDASDAAEYDVVVVGAGPVGENVADRARAAGLTTAVVENELIGGECSYWACMPSKALLRPVTARADARRVPGLRQAVRGPLDAAEVFAHRDYYVSNWKDDGQVSWLESIGVDIHRGRGRLDGPRKVTVESPVGRAVHPDRGARRGGLHRQPRRRARSAGRGRGEPLDQP